MTGGSCILRFIDFTELLKLLRFLRCRPVRSRRTDCLRLWSHLPVSVSRLRSRACTRAFSCAWEVSLLAAGSGIPLPSAFSKWRFTGQAVSGWGGRDRQKDQAAQKQGSSGIGLRSGGLPGVAATLESSVGEFPLRRWNDQNFDKQGKDPHLPR